MSSRREVVLVLAEVAEGRLHPSAYELLGKAREMAEAKGLSVVAGLAGHGVSDLAWELVEYGADEVYVLDCENLETFDPIAFKEAYLSIVREADPSLVLVAATNKGRSVAPRLAAALGTGLTADCTDLYLDDKGEVVQVRPAFAGNVYAHIATKTRPVMTTVRPGVFRPATRVRGKAGRVLMLPSSLCPRKSIDVLSVTRKTRQDVTRAGVIFVVGRGVRRDDLERVKKIASLVGAAVGATRKAVEAGLASRDCQVGYSGATVRPRVYVGLGVSGSPMHVIGMKDSDVVVSVNVDPEAPIGSLSDYFIVGDVREFLSALEKELGKVLKAREG